MISLKCTVCGGDIGRNGDVGICDSCGRKISFEGLNEDRLIENRNRANEARVKHDYSAAERAWSRIAADEPDSAEAHWNLAISRYGIDYVWDDLTGEFHPSMNRIRWERFTDDSDYRLAVQYADENALVYYMQEGKQLDILQERLLSLIKNEPEYDVFLCVDDAMPTSDRGYADEIYRELSGKNLRVFYGRNALEGVSKTEQEPYVFSALYSSKVMVLFASAAEQLYDLSVKNEWSRFLSLMEQDKQKYLIPAYIHMRPEFFPDDIPAREALDLKNSGSMMDLVRGVLRFAGKDNVNAGYAEVLRIKQQMTDELKKKNFREVVRLGREGAEIAPDDPDIWYYLFLGENQAESDSDLSLKTIEWMDSRSFTRAYELAARKRRLVLDRVKANWDAYQQRIAQDKQFAQEEKASKENIARTAAKARTLMMKEAYREAFDLLNDNVTATQEIAELRDDAELGCEYGKIDRENYLTDALNREKPGVIQKFLSISAPIRKESLLQWDAKTSLLGALMMAFLYYCGFLNGTVEYGAYGPTMQICRIFGPIVFGLGLAGRACGGIMKALPCLGYIIVADVVHFMFLPFVVEELFSKSSKTIYMMLMAVFVILAVVAVCDIPRQSKARRKKCTVYYSKIIAPLEKKITENYKQKYEKLAQYAPLGTLTTVWNKYMREG